MMDDENDELMVKMKMAIEQTETRESWKGLGLIGMRRRRGVK